MANQLNTERLKKWRLILGKQADEDESVSLSEQMQGMDTVLEDLYESSDKRGGLGGSTPKINRWLGDIRKYFPTSVVQMMQKDAFERLDLEEMLLEPELLESIEPDIHLVGTLLSLNKVMPAKTKETARTVIQKVVTELEKKLRNPMQVAIKGALSRSVRNRRPKYNEIDWNRTIRANLKHYQHEYKTIIPHNLIGYGRKGKALREIILLVDQSGSMASSVIYSSVFGAVMASLKSIKTQMIVFDTSVVDLTEYLTDPVELLFGTQLGGGTDINKALGYVQQQIRTPNDTILVLISDLYEGGKEREMLKKCMMLKESGVQFIVLLALSDEGKPMFDRSIASKLATMNIPSFACTPDKFPDLMAAAIQKEDIKNWMGKNDIV
ncbi:MAG: Mg-chelatase subunit ChlD [Saprospiraceae bacterium]|jgi:Mg-chelatase subunit ChlD